VRFAFSMPHLMRLKATAQPWEAQVTGADQTRMARRADVLGYDMISVPEHMIIPNEHIDLSGPHYFHAAAGQAYFAGATERILINSSIAILPLQHPIVTAKALATIDWMSSGRIIATFGVGWLEKEFELLGVPFHERGAMSEEYLAAIIELWTKDDPAFEGKYVSFKDVAFEPKPFRKPHLPIWMGGDADAVLRRTARYASGWWPFLTRPEDIPARVDFIKSQAAFRGGPFEVMYGFGTTRIGEGHKVLDDPRLQRDMSAQAILDRLGWFETLGVTMSSFPMPPVRDADEYMDYAQWAIEEIAPKLAASGSVDTIPGQT
jgi:probable F420-dependent oxidoreductase